MPLGVVQELCAAGKQELFSDSCQDFQMVASLIIQA
jgi:hypothetical protein